MILCCGEALIDMIPEATASGAMGYVPHTGGAVFNTAIGLGRLGVATQLLSGVSRDSFGALLETTLTDNGVGTAHLIRSDRLSTLAVVHLKDGSATYSFYDEGSAGRMFTSEDLPALPDDIDVLYFGGISLVAEPAADAYATLALREAGRRLVMLDPNIRPGFITDEAGYRARLGKMIAVSDIVKVSDEDLEWITDGGAEALMAQGTRAVIVTMGEQGAQLHTQGHVITVPAITATLVDTVGAGDTFNAGFLAGLNHAGLASKSAFAQAPAEAMRPALELAARVAAITVSRAGANPPFASEVGLG